MQHAMDNFVMLISFWNEKIHCYQYGINNYSNVQ